MPPFPGITAATGLLTSDLKYDQMRTVFMIQGAIDADRIDRELEGIAGELRRRLRDDGVADEDIQVTTALDCRYLGQGYELRVAPRGPVQRGGPRGVPPHAPPGVRARVHRPDRGRQPARHRDRGAPKVERLPPADGAMDDALIGEGEGVFRVDGELASLAPPPATRALAPGEPFEGPAIVFQRDTTVLVPPGWSGCAQPSGNLILAR